MKNMNTKKKILSGLTNFFNEAFLGKAPPHQQASRNPFPHATPPPAAEPYSTGDPLEDAALGSLPPDWIVAGERVAMPSPDGQMPTFIQQEILTKHGKFLLVYKVRYLDGDGAIVEPSELKFYSHLTGRMHAQAAHCHMAGCGIVITMQTGCVVVTPGSVLFACNYHARMIERKHRPLTGEPLEIYSLAHYLDQKAANES